MRTIMRMFCLFNNKQLLISVYDGSWFYGYVFGCVTEDSFLGKFSKIKTDTGTFMWTEFYRSWKKSFFYPAVNCHTADIKQFSKFLLRNPSVVVRDTINLISWCCVIKVKLNHFKFLLANVLIVYIKVNNDCGMV